LQPLVFARVLSAPFFSRTFFFHKKERKENWFTFACEAA
jgi:hypothetical protein